MGVKLVTQIPSEPLLLYPFYGRKILVYGRFALLFIICSLGDDDAGFLFTGRDSYTGFTGIPFIGFCCKCK